MTMLIAGHETTAAVLTWAVYLLAQVSTWLCLFTITYKVNDGLFCLKPSLLVLQNPSKMKKAQAEIDLVLGKGSLTFESLKALK